MKEPQKNIFRVFPLLCYFVFGLPIVAVASAERVRIAIPQANLNYLSVYVADAKEF